MPEILKFSISPAITAQLSPPSSEPAKKGFSRLSASGSSFRVAAHGETAKGKSTGAVQPSSGKFTIVEKLHEVTFAPMAADNGVEGFAIARVQMPNTCTRRPAAMYSRTVNAARRARPTPFSANRRNPSPSLA